MIPLTTRHRSHVCGALRASDVGARVRLAGWILRKRDHGGLLFVDLRDHYGVVQCVFEPSRPGFAQAEALGPESVIAVEGAVVARSPETLNASLDTGEVEVQVAAITTLSAADALPMPVFGDRTHGEEQRLRWRFLDLRRERPHTLLAQRSRIIHSLRGRMWEAGFLEMTTPILTASSPEGARDFLVPSRRAPGKFYALPQAPQVFKQLIMASGYDRYFQIAPCFRDEDARADRLPGEFYQLDLEMAFVDENDVLEAVEPIIAGLFQEFADGRTLTPTPFPRLAWHDAMARYGSDRPDLRNPIVLADVSAAFAAEGCAFRAFKDPVLAGTSVVLAIPAPGAASRPRAFFDKMQQWARETMRAPGIGYIAFGAGGGGGGGEGEGKGGGEDGALAAKGPIARHVDAAGIQAIADTAGVGAGDAVFFACAPLEEARALAAAARTRLGDLLDLKDANAFAFCWVVDFPMYERDSQGSVIFSHNPFSMPHGGAAALDAEDPLSILAHQYDLVCNGVELSSGAVRNHLPDALTRAFGIAGYAPEEVESRFGALLRAFRCGAPPHGGMAPGVDRMVAMLCREPSLREMTLFPMNQQAEHLMMDAPSEASSAQLRELGLRLAPRRSPSS